MPVRSPTRRNTRRVSRTPLSGASTRLPPNRANILAWYRGQISDGRLIPYRPASTSATPEVKGSGFTGAGTGAVTGLLTSDTITAGGTVPTCTTNGTLTISADCWDIYVHRDGVLWAFWPGINVTPLVDPPATWTELDASGLGHHLYLTTTTIVEAVDGSGTNYANERGFTVADGSQYLDDAGVDVIGAGWRIPALVDGSGCASWSESFEELIVDGEAMMVDDEKLYVGT